MNHIFYQTKTKYTNTGDALINHALINTLRSYGVLHANYGSDIPEEFLSELGILPEERVLSHGELAFIFSVLKCAVKSKRAGDNVYVFSGPGDMFGGGTRLVLRNFLSGLVFPVFRVFGVKIVRIGRSVGPISKLMAVSEWIRGLFLSHYYVRDSRSLRMCHEMGIRRAKFCPDMSWLYDCEHPRTINHTNVVMVNLRDRIFDDYEQSVADATLLKCEELLEKLNRLMNGDMKVLVAYQIAEDAEFSRQIFERLKNRYTVEYVDTQIKLSEMKKYYRKVDFHISNRMHSLLAGYKYGSLPIALVDTNRHIKIASTYQDCNLEDLMVDIFSPLDVNAVSEMYQDREQLMNVLFDVEKSNCEQIFETLDLIF